LECAFGVVGKILIWNVGNIDLKLITTTENSNKFQVLEGKIN
jgi:hypothetical protein